MQQISATVVIATKNRKHDLRRAIASCLAQTVVPEVIVLDDGSTDGTERLIRQEFPGIRFYRSDKSLSVVVQRNRGAYQASSEFIFSIDDDAEFPSPHTIKQTLAEFIPVVGAVAIPFVNVKQSNKIHQRAPRREGIYLTDIFFGTAYAIRRSLFLDVGGYNECLRQVEEEVDLCIRMLERGYFTRLGNADPIHHYESPVRDNRWRTVFGSRNKILFCWHNVPMPDLLFHLPAACLNRVIFGFRIRQPIQVAKGVLMGFGACFFARGTRRPVSRKTYRLFRRMRKAGALQIDIAQQFLRDPRG